MCTLIIRVPEVTGEPTRLLAIRDEDPGRPWDPLGPGWPQEYPGLIGVRDQRAGGAWLAADPEGGHVAVLLNRADRIDLAYEQVQTRGTIALEAVAGRLPAGSPPMHGFNLVDVEHEETRLIAWDGIELRTTLLTPGTHMIAHEDVDDLSTPRIEAWLEEFRASVSAEKAEGEDWWTPWLRVIEQSASVDPADERALIREQSYEGTPSVSLLVCVATVSASGADVRYAALPRPGHWRDVHLH